MTWIRDLRQKRAYVTLLMQNEDELEDASKCLAQKYSLELSDNFVNEI